MEHSDLDGMTPSQRAFILQFPPEDTTWPAVGINMNSAPNNAHFPDAIHKAFEVENDTDRSPQAFVSWLAKQEIILKAILPADIWWRCYRNFPRNLFLDTKEAFPQVTLQPIRPAALFHGYEETYVLYQGAPRFTYRPRPEAHVAGDGAVWLLHAFDGHWTQADRHRASTNATTAASDALLAVLEELSRERAEAASPDQDYAPTTGHLPAPAPQQQ